MKSLGLCFSSSFFWNRSFHNQWKNYRPSGKFGLLGNHESEIVTACRSGRGLAHFVLQDHFTTMQHVFSGGLRCKSGSPDVSLVCRWTSHTGDGCMSPLHQGHLNLFPGALCPQCLSLSRTLVVLSSSSVLTSFWMRIHSNLYRKKSSGLMMVLLSHCDHHEISPDQER